MDENNKERHNADDTETLHTVSSMNVADDHVPVADDHVLVADDHVPVAEEEIDYEHLNRSKFGYLSVVFCVLTIVFQLADIGTDINVAYLHYRNGDYQYAGLTIGIVLMAGVVSTGIAIRYYLIDPLREPWTLVEKMYRCLMLGSILLAPTLRNIEFLINWYSYNRTKKENRDEFYYYTMMLNEKRYATFLGLIESFLESGFQLLLQVYLIVRHAPYFLHDKPTTCLDSEREIENEVLFSLFVSLLAFSWSPVAHFRAIDMEERYPKTRVKTCCKEFRIPHVMTLFALYQWLASVYLIGSRIVILCLFAASFSIWLPTIHLVLGHWMLSCLLLTALSTADWNVLISGTGLTLLLITAVLNIITYHSNLRSADALEFWVFQTFMLIENSLLLSGVAYIGCFPSVVFIIAACYYFPWGFAILMKILENQLADQMRPLLRNRKSLYKLLSNETIRKVSDATFHLPLRYPDTGRISEPHPIILVVQSDTCSQKTNTCFDQTF